MEHIVRSIEVRSPLQQVYRQWTRYEDLPEFVPGMTGVEKLDDSHLHCYGEILGRRREWDTEIIDQAPYDHITWVSASIIPSVGVVSFEPLGPELTRVDVLIAYEPERAPEDIRRALKLLGACMQDAVDDFKSLIEQGERQAVAPRRIDIGTGDSNAGAPGEDPGGADYLKRRLRE